MLREKREKKYVVILINATKHFDKIKHLFMIKTLNKLRIEGNFLNLVNICMTNL